MKKYLVLLPMIMMIAFSSCRRDNITEETDINIPDPETGIITGLTGVVKDESGQAISQAIVTLGESETITDNYGQFSMSDVLINAEGSLITFEQAGYFDSYKFVFPQSNIKAHTKVKMIAKGEPFIFNSASGGELESNGAKVEFPENGMSLENGTAYNGEVIAYHKWLDPTSDELKYIMPGDLRALNENGEERQLATYGMIAVELESPNGEKLQLAEGKKANLTFPLPNEIQGQAPDQIPLWYFEESTGTWMEEGQGIKEGSFYRGEVSHFSFWNCDAPFPLIKLSGSLVFPNGVSASHRIVEIIMNNNLRTANAMTNADGFFCGKIPSNESLTLNVYGNCASPIHTMQLDPSSEDIDLNEILIDESNYSYRIQGYLQNCQMEAVADGYVVARIGGFYQLLYPNVDGFIDEVFEICNINDVKLTGVSSEDFTVSDEKIISIDPANLVIDFGVLRTCNSNEEFLSVKYNERPTYLFETFSAYILNGEELLIYGRTPNTNYTWMSSVPLLSAGTETPTFIMYFLDPDPDNPEGIYLTCSDDLTNLCESNFTMTIADVENGFVSGSFLGNLPWTTSGSTVDLDGHFKIKIENEALTTGTISGRIWTDENENGIRESGEGPYEEMELRPYIRNGENARFDTYPINIKTSSPEPGTYKIENIIQNSNYNIQVRGSFKPTLKDVGDDDFDSDFNPISVTFDRYSTDDFYFAGGSDIENIDLGIIDQEIICQVIVNGCDGTGRASIAASGGTPPYSFLWSNGANNSFQENLAAGYYTISLTDANGIESLCEFIIPGLENTIEVFAWKEVTGSSNDYYEEGIDELLDGVKFKYWYEDNPSNIMEGVTDAQGKFKFEQVPWVPSTSLFLEVEVPDGLDLVAQGQGGNSEFDSDFNPNTRALTLWINECDGSWKYLAGFKEQ